MAPDYTNLKKEMEMNVNRMRGTGWLTRTVSAVLAVAVLVGGPGLEELESASARNRASPRARQRFENTEVRLGIIDGGIGTSSSIEVSGFDAPVADVDINLIDIDFFGDGTQDIDVLLVGPDNRFALILSDVGGFTPTTNVTLVLDDQQPELLPSNTALKSGFFQPTNVGSPDTMNLANGPFTPPSGASLGVFNGINPNGTWTLVVADDSTNDVSLTGGGINGGWGLTITTANGVPAAEADRFQVKAGKTLNVPPAGVLENDNDPDGDELTAVLQNQPKKGQIDLQPDGSFTYRANKKAKGKDSFSYRAEDGGELTAFATVDIAIKGAKKKKRR